MIRGCIVIPLSLAAALLMATSGAAIAQPHGSAASANTPTAPGTPSQAGPSPQRPYGIDRRTAWTTSRIIGTPTPPPPYKTQRAFPNLRFRQPVVITAAPGTDRLFVAELDGRLYSFRNDPDVERADLFLDLREELRSIDPHGPAEGVREVYGLAFHPDFERNRYVYICYTLRSRQRGQELPNGTRVSRFRVMEGRPPRCDPASEKVILTWLSGGHNAGCLKFGPDGYLYISTGDAAAPSPPDPLRAGQDVGNLLSAILRIDVDREQDGRPYAIPDDNPFVHLAGARGEVWAYGFRNPWRMSFDRATGELWVGDVGWELWEMVHRVERGGNYGWSIMEGPQEVLPDGPRGPTPIRPPLIALSHARAASITGGCVYHGRRLPDLAGAYIFGDWETRRIWAARVEGERLVSMDELTQPAIRVVAFGEDHDGELYILDYDGGAIHQLAPNDAQDTTQDFPRKLSRTGLFRSTADNEPAPGVIPFSVNAAQWADHATAQRLIALPGRSTVMLHDRPVSRPGTMFSTSIEFPEGAVLAKTYSIEMRRGEPASRRRIETQALHFDGRYWHGYAYRWNEAQTDADLVAAEGDELPLTIHDPQAPGGVRRQMWRFHGRDECLRCHNPWADHALAFHTAQLNRPHDYGEVTDNQLRTLAHIGIVARSSGQTRRDGNDEQQLEGREEPRSGGGDTSGGGDGTSGGGGGGETPPLDPASLPALADPYDESADLDRRARSYLHVNCAHCHRFGAGGSARIDLRHDLPLAETQTIGERPMQGDFGLTDGRIIAPGRPYRSVLLYRASKLGPGRMPYLGSEVIDQRGLRLLRNWIAHLPPPPEVPPPPPEGVARASRPWIVGLPEVQGDQKLAEAPGGPEPQTVSGALRLAHALHDGLLPPDRRAEVIERAMAGGDPRIIDLFEPFVPAERRAERLGPNIEPRTILSLRGDAARGRELFFEHPTLSCRGCHRIGDAGGLPPDAVAGDGATSGGSRSEDRSENTSGGGGGAFGPDLAGIGGRYDRAALLDQILDPSATIAEGYAGFLVQMNDGRAVFGFLAERTDERITLKTATQETIHLPADQVQAMVPQPQSLMPPMLLSGLSAQQAADLLAYLTSLK